MAARRARRRGPARRRRVDGGIRGTARTGPASGHSPAARRHIQAFVSEAPSTSSRRSTWELYAEPAPPLADGRQPARGASWEDAMEVADGDVIEQASLAVDDWHLACARAVADGQRRVTCSDPWIVYRLPSSVKRLSGWSARVSRPGSGRWPVRIAGTATSWSRARSSPAGTRSHLAEPRKVRIPLRVERPVCAHQRAHRELVQDHEDDGGVASYAERRPPRRRRRRAAPSPRK